MQAKDILNIFKQLEEDGSFVNLKLSRTKYEFLTIVTGIEKRNGEPFFLIDYPKGFRSAIANLDKWKLRFEFVGRDKVQHIFETSGGEIVKNNVRLRFPEFIKRIQRREHFRIEVPIGTKFRFQVNSVDIVELDVELDVVNVSSKGVLGICIKLSDDVQLIQFLKEEDELHNVKLILPDQNEITIKKAWVKRIKENPSANRYQYGFEFIEIKKNEEINLVKLVYDLQKKSLQQKQQRGF